MQYLSTAKKFQEFQASQKGGATGGKKDQKKEKKQEKPKAKVCCYKGWLSSLAHYIIL